MTDSGGLLLVVLSALLFGIIAGMVGARKGAGAFGFLLGIILGPLGLLVAILYQGDRRPCPLCREMVRRDARICPHCRSDLRGATPARA